MNEVHAGTVGAATRKNVLYEMPSVRGLLAYSAAYIEERMDVCKVKVGELLGDNFIILFCPVVNFGRRAINYCLLNLKNVY